MSILTISFSPVVLFCVRHSARLATLPLPLPFSRTEISSTPAARAPEPSRRSLPLYDHSREFGRSEEHTSELQSLMRISYATFCWKKKKSRRQKYNYNTT